MLVTLLFPHWQTIEDVDFDEFENYCLNPALHRRGIVKEQCHKIDPEFKSRMPEVWVKNPGVIEQNLFE